LRTRKSAALKRFAEGRESKMVRVFPNKTLTLFVFSRVLEAEVQHGG